MRNDEMEVMRKKLDQVGQERLLENIKSHELTRGAKSCLPIARFIASAYNYGWNSTKLDWCFHLDPERTIDSIKTLDDIINELLENPELSSLFASGKLPYVRPTVNPWLSEHLHLGRQGAVTGNEPDLARRWQEQARRINPKKVTL